MVGLLNGLHPKRWSPSVISIKEIDFGLIATIRTKEDEPSRAANPHEETAKKFAPNLAFSLRIRYNTTDIDTATG